MVIQKEVCLRKSKRDEAVLLMNSVRLNLNELGPEASEMLPSLGTHIYIDTSVKFESPPHACVDLEWPIILHSAVTE